MKLSSALSSDFDYQTRSRGVQCFRSGAVRIKQGSDVSVHAKVQGSQFYEVGILWHREHGLNLRCDCPFFESSGPCKHLWAAILAAEARGFLAGVPPDAALTADYEYSEDDFADRDDEESFHSSSRQVTPPVPPVAPRQPDWQRHLSAVTPSGLAAENWPVNREVLYVVDVPGSVYQGALMIQILTREPKLKGGWKKPVAPRLTRGTLASLPEADREILGLLSSSHAQNDWAYSYDVLPASYRLTHPMSTMLVPRIANTGRGMLQLTRDSEPAPFVWDDGEPWQFHLRMDLAAGNKCRLIGCLRRGAEEIDIAAPVLITEGGLVFLPNRVSRLEENASFPWMSYLRKTGPVESPKSDAPQLLAALLQHPIASRVEVPEDLRYREIRPAPRPCLTVRSSSWQPGHLRAHLSFDYDGRRISGATQGRGLYDAETRVLLVRDPDAEQAAQAYLQQLGLSGPSRYYDEKEPAWALAPKKLPAIARGCLEAGWHIEAEGKAFRRAAAMRMEVSSGVDWFELHGEVDYGGAAAKLPALLAALRRGENMVALDDGTYGLLPEEWLNRLGPIAGLGTAAGGHMRFRRNQAGLLDALLATQPEVRCDETFARVRDELRRFQGIRAAEQPAGFAGQLRDYQREGVGWMEFLRRFAFGGCLADDMGVGKTAQVLALLENRRALRSDPSANGDAPRGPSLVVVPKSLVFNWKDEAARFTPQLRILDHTGTDRDFNSFAAYDVVLTTYGTLRRDALLFKDLEFDYVVLDEAQAIKNASTESAKAVRLLRGHNRLALSGTPVENHLGELWSLFEFLNPGMLGAASVFKLAGGAARNPSEETRSLLAQALRPFILRRTKEQVARELPSKSEQIIFCELEPPQRKLYNELRAHYRDSLLNTIAAQGLAKSKIQVLEALLRLRQAACHPGLLDPKRQSDASAKLDLLLYRLQEVVEEGHKALVFSQFTSLLSILRERLDAAGIVYEYLDGATRDRRQCVERFQTDERCRLFLISLKAGGLGLNLTAAEYVFLLDPWWNPAVEAQAVDRAHRIGQTRQVFAYRLIARDTVEEKVLQLQNTKRDLAASIISADNSPLTNLQREDLELLLS
jgi:superfamily II DNA or RNA helicase